MERHIIIIGGGPIGLFSIFQAGMLKMKCTVIEALDILGGQCNALYPEKPIYDIPGYPSILAKDLIDKLIEQASPFDPEYLLSEKAVTLEKNEQGDFCVTTSSEKKVYGKAIVIAAGVGAFGPNKPLLPDIQEYEGKSVFYSIKEIEKMRNASIVIAGGGDSAVDWALTLSSIAKKIYLVHRRAQFKCLPENLERLHNLANTSDTIKIVTPYQLHKLVGKNGILEKVVLKSEYESLEIETDILLLFFGLSANLSDMNTWGLKIMRNRIYVDNNYETNMSGVYAIGDVAEYEGKLRLILTGFAEAAKVMRHAYNRIFGEKPCFEYSTLHGIPR